MGASSLTETQLPAQMSEASDLLQRSFAGLMLHYASGDAMDMTDTLTLPIQLTSVRDYVAARPAR